MGKRRKPSGGGSPHALAMLLRCEPVMRDGRSGAPRLRTRGAAKDFAIRDSKA